jgi:high affinity Mn2+ porin
MLKNQKTFVIGCLLVQIFGFPIIAYAQEETAVIADQSKPEEVWNAKFQSTYIGQKKPSFDAPYTGSNSLRADAARAYSFSATAYFGYRPWQGGELYLDPEVIQSVPFSNLHGLGGLSNSEQLKTSGSDPTFYLARLYLKQTFGFGHGSDTVESDENQLAGMNDKRRLVITLGKLSVIDIFENNAYGHDARTQFTNGAFATHGSFDYAADARGYTLGAAAEYYYDNWAVRAGRFEEPLESNGLPLDHNILKHYGDQLEVEHSHSIDDQAGKVRLLAFHNQAVMGSFADAITYANIHGGVPDVANVRKENSKIGYGISLEQNLGSDVGVFARVNWADGKTETYSFTEIENSMSIGAIVKGARWGRGQDTVGLAVAQNGLNKTHREYLKAGGLGAFIGDGQLNYRPERIAEVYYNIGLCKNAWLAFGLQNINNPAYNADRGPVNFGTVRLHTEF